MRNLCLPDGAEREKTLQGLLLLGVLAVLVVAVLLPLAQIAPEWRHPETGLTPEEMIRLLPPAETGGILRICTL